MQEEATKKADVLTLREVAKYLKISVAQVYRYVDREINPLPVIFISDKTKRVRRVDLEKWLTKQQKDESDDGVEKENGGDR